MESKPRILVSKCLNFSSCRYDGSMIPFSFIETLQEYVDFITVCPEEAIGLGTPRPTVRLESADGGKEIKMIKSKTGEDLTTDMKGFTEEFLNSVEGIEGAILKAKSPSCGLFGIKIYDQESGIPISPSKGLFAEGVVEKFPLLSIEEEGRLRDYVIREHFLIKLYTLSRWKQAKESKKIGQLMDFHAHHKYLFMCYNQDVLREMGRILAKHKENDLKNVILNYETLLAELLKSSSKTKNKINAFIHVFGYFKKHLTSAEKQFFLEQIEQYRRHSITYHSISAILESWTVKYDIDYLKDQILFSPFPKELMTLRDSGKAVMK